MIKAPTLSPNKFPDYVKSFKFIIDEQEFDDEVDMLDTNQLEERKTIEGVRRSIKDPLSMYVPKLIYSYF
tara:strand:+ start:336 stop:545 length:210 start_codon:yes stop_codon:yes gene_type:complete